MPDYRITINVPVATDQQFATSERMVRARNEAQAIRHVVKDVVMCERLQIDDAIRLGTQGVEIEVASEQP